MLPAAQRRHLAQARLDDAGHGWDRFGMSRDGVALGLSMFRPLYEHYFRVRSHGAENIPSEGATIVVANHSGMLPLDGMMLWTDIVTQTDPPRVPRPVADFFVPALPFVNVIFARGGVIGGTRGNVHAALEAGELLELFPEGVRGISKGFAERYRLQHWSVGHAELAIRHRAAIVPTAIIGAEESWPQVAKIESLQGLGMSVYGLAIDATGDLVVEWGAGRASESSIEIRLLDGDGTLVSAHAMDDGAFVVPAADLQTLAPGPLDVMVARRRSEEVAFSEGTITVMMRSEQWGFFDLY